jgi:hypothetical protein
VLSTWTGVDTSSTDFLLGTLTNMNTWYIPGGITLSTDNADHLIPGFESGGGWTGDGSGSITGYDRQCAAFNGFSPRTGSCMAMSQSLDGDITNITVEVLDNANAVLQSQSVTPTNHVWTQGTISLSAFTGKSIKIRFRVAGSPCVGGAELGFQSNASFLASGTNMTFYYGKDDASCDRFMIDDTANGRSTITTGNVVSQTFNTSISSPAWSPSTASWTSNGNTITPETQVSQNGSSFDSLVSWSTNSAPTSAGKQYIRYKISIAAGPASTGLPYLSDVTLNARAATGTYVGAAESIGTAITSWGNFTRDQTLNGGTIGYSIRTASYTGGLAAATWVTLTADSQITASTNSFAQIGSTFTITKGTQNPTLSSYGISWNEGTLSRTYGAIDKKHRLMWSVTEGTSAVNNATYIYDPRFQTWLKYSVPFDAPAKAGDYIYYGSPSAGTTYKYPSGSSDSGSAYTSYWKSKDYLSGDPFTEKNYSSISLVALGQGAGTTLDLTYSVNNSSATTYTFTQVPATGLTLLRKNRLLANGTFGTFFNLKFGNTIADNPFEVYAIRYDYTPRTWRVLP